MLANFLAIAGMIGVFFCSVRVSIGRSGLLCRSFYFVRVGADRSFGLYSIIGIDLHIRIFLRLSFTFVADCDSLHLLARFLQRF